MFELVTGISDLALTMPTGSVHADTLANFVTSVPTIEPDLDSSFAKAGSASPRSSRACASSRVFSRSPSVAR